MFKRVYRLILGKPFNFSNDKGALVTNDIALGGTPYIDTGLGKAKILEEYFATNDPNAIVIEDHNIEFSIEKTGGSNEDSNKAEITIHNLSDNQVNYLSNNAGSHLFVTLEAGYEDEGSHTIFRGNVMLVEDELQRPGRKTKLTLSDGGVFAKQQLTSRSYKKGTPVDAIVEDLIKDLDLPRGQVAKLGNSVVTKSSVQFLGTASKNLKRITESHNLAYNVQDSFVNIIDTVFEKAQKKAEESQRKQLVPLITPGTGLLGSVSYKEDSSSSTTKESKIVPPSGIKFKTLLMGSVLPNDYVRVEDRNFKGTYRVIEVKHKGEYEGDTWFTEYEAEDIGVTSDTGDEITQEESQNLGGSEEEVPEDQEVAFWKIPFKYNLSPIARGIYSNFLSSEDE